MLVAGIPFFWDIENGRDLALGRNQPIATFSLGSGSEHHIEYSIAQWDRKNRSMSKAGGQDIESLGILQGFIGT